MSSKSLKSFKRYEDFLHQYSFGQFFSQVVFNHNVLIKVRLGGTLQGFMERWPFNIWYFTSHIAVSHLGASKLIRINLHISWRVGVRKRSNWPEVWIKSENTSVSFAALIASSWPDNRRTSVVSLVLLHIF